MQGSGLGSALVLHVVIVLRAIGKFQILFIYTKNLHPTNQNKRWRLFSQEYTSIKLQRTSNAWVPQLFMFNWTPGSKKQQRKKKQLAPPSDCLQHKLLVSFTWHLLCGYSTLRSPVSFPGQGSGEEEEGLRRAAPRSSSPLTESDLHLSSLNLSRVRMDAFPRGRTRWSVTRMPTAGGIVSDWSVFVRRWCLVAAEISNVSASRQTWRALGEERRTREREWFPSAREIIVLLVFSALTWSGKLLQSTASENRIDLFLLEEEFTRR